MAKVKGIIQLNGTIGGINFYTLNGVQIARKAGGGFNGKAIKTEANMEKVRQNAREFGAVSQFVKHFKGSLAPMLYSFRFPKLHGQLMKLFFGIKKLDVVAVEGSRSVGGGLETLSGRHLLVGFSLPTYHSIYKALYQQVIFDGTSGTFDFGCLRPLFKMLSKEVAAVTVQVGVMDFSTSTVAIPMLQRNILTIDRDSLDSYSMTLSVDGVVPEKGMAVLSLCYLEYRDGVLSPLLSKDCFYLEVVSVWG
ncbi:hypothetical protein [Flavobacterium sp.]